MNKIKQRGFGALELMLAVIFISAALTIGYVVWHANHHAYVQPADASKLPPVPAGN